jgi:hypothetical protein
MLRPTLPRRDGIAIPKSVDIELEMHVVLSASSELLRLHDEAKRLLDVSPRHEAEVCEQIVDRYNQLDAIQRVGL